MKDIGSLIIVIIFAVVLLAVWGKIFPKTTPDDSNPLEAGAKNLVHGVAKGSWEGTGDTVGEAEAGVIAGIEKLPAAWAEAVTTFWGNIIGIFKGDGSPAQGGAAAQTWGGVSQGNPFGAAPAQPLPYGNPPAGLSAAGTSSDYGT